MKGINELISKWEEQRDMHRNVCEDVLMWTKEDRLKSSHQLQAICAVLGDLKDLREFITTETEKNPHINEVKQ